jgi:hypothetical protein
MGSHLPPNISSFVIRFVIDSTPETGQKNMPYRGAIRHIQTDEELNFANWEEAVTFIRRFVPLETEGGRGST